MVCRTVLENGIRILSEAIPSAHSASIGFWVANGSRHEDDANGGISHFIEHMLFKGTCRRSALTIAKEIDSLGGVLNAFTAREYSCYYAKVLGRHLDQAVDLLADILLNSTFDADELEKERRVILQEISMVEDTPDEKIHDLFCAHFWADHPLGRPILGSTRSVTSLARDHLLDFMQSRYCGRNLVVCAAGQVDHERLVAQIGRVFAALDSGSSCVLASRPRPSGGAHHLEKDLEQLHLCLGTPAPAQSEAERFHAQLLNAILGGSMSSRLFQKVREEAGLAYSIYSFLNTHSDCGALAIYAGISPLDFDQTLELILAEMRLLREQQVSEEELRGAKEQLKGHFLLSLESTDNRMTRLARNEIYLQGEVSPTQVLAAIDAVSSADLLLLARRLFSGRELSLDTIGPWQGAPPRELALTLEQ